MNTVQDLRNAIINKKNLKVTKDLFYDSLVNLNDDYETDEIDKVKSALHIDKNNCYVAENTILNYAHHDFYNVYYTVNDTDTEIYFALDNFILDDCENYKYLEIAD